MAPSEQLVKQFFNAFRKERGSSQDVLNRMGNFPFFSTPYFLSKLLILLKVAANNRNVFDSFALTKSGYDKHLTKGSIYLIANNIPIAISKDDKPRNYNYRFYRPDFITELVNYLYAFTMVYKRYSYQILEFLENSML